MYKFKITSFKQYNAVGAKIEKAQGEFYIFEKIYSRLRNWGYVWVYTNDGIAFHCTQNAQSSFYNKYDTIKVTKFLEEGPELQQNDLIEVL